MLSKIYNELANVNIPMFDTTTNEFIGQAAIISFSVVDNDKMIKPFLFFSYEEVKDRKSIYFRFKITKDNQNKYHLVSLEKNLIEPFLYKEASLVIIPIASLINELNQEGIQLKYTGIPSTLFINEKFRERLNPIDTVTLWTYDFDLFKNGYEKSIILKNNNVTTFDGIINELNSFYLEITQNTPLFVPVFLLNHGGYFSKNDIYMGNRFCLIGLMTKKEAKYGYVIRIEEIERFIKLKYPN